MRVNVYAEEMTDRVEIIAKEIDGHKFTGLRLYLALPVSVPTDFRAQGSPYTEATKDPAISRVVYGKDAPVTNLQGPFMHRPGDDDSAAVTFWGKQDLRALLRKMLAMLDEHYESSDTPSQTPGEKP
jgi:hypothetical protein